MRMECSDCLIKMWNVNIQRHVYHLCTYACVCMYTCLAANGSEPLSCFPVLVFTVYCLLFATGQRKSREHTEMSQLRGFL